MRSALYAGRVVHARLRPKRHRLSYRVFSLLLDLDEVETLGSRLRFFGHNRAAIFSFFDKDHGDGGPNLRGWIAARLGAAGAALAAPRIEILCYPRILGYVFNPLTVYFCRDGDELRAILYEVHNTFGEKRTYVIRVARGANTVEQSCGKEMYVSPFVPMDCTYDFRITPPGERASIGIAERDREGLLLTASFTGERRELSDSSLLRAFVSYPLMTLKVTAAIHWEALRLWAKGVRYIARKPAVERVATTIVD
jgi:DUF1365 family protein